LNLRMRACLQQLIGRAVLLGSLAAVAVGMSGLLAWGLGAVSSDRYVAGDQSGVTYSAARCTEFFEYAPGAHSCEEAATQHQFGEVVQYRGAAGVLGLFGCALFFVARRRWPAWTRTDALPHAFTATVATVAFGVAAAGLLGLAVHARLIDQTAGSGAYLSGGI